MGFLVVVMDSILRPDVMIDLSSSGLVLLILCQRIPVHSFEVGRRESGYMCLDVSVELSM